MFYLEKRSGFRSGRAGAHGVMWKFERNFVGDPTKLDLKLTSR